MLAAANEDAATSVGWLAIYAESQFVPHPNAPFYEHATSLCFFESAFLLGLALGPRMGLLMQDRGRIGVALFSTTTAILGSLWFSSLAGQHTIELPFALVLAIMTSRAGIRALAHTDTDPLAMSLHELEALKEPSRGASFGRAALLVGTVAGALLHTASDIVLLVTVTAESICCST
eukprot:CAMPEP_0115869466 /NCGR_PEP_ID=MMETSP0287-20121206/21824_1 /TAXON_ID=412157 /ORGANISM="Chrysochromulina rotalis, Strain UIO044" /LENGTH=175 /DNA_ID=CAMNT_0003324155 /DNA_START=121 /DNA_END=648 /DNA_ORIENTATION=-